MGFKSLFPFFNRTELAPSEPDLNPDIDSKFGRVVARLEAASEGLETFAFVRVDRNGRLHIVDAPIFFDNVRSASVPTIVGFVTISPETRYRQKAFIYNIASTSKDLYVKIASISRFLTDIQPNELIELTGFIDELQINATLADGNVRILEF